MSKDYNKNIMAWESEPLRERLIKARILLYCHGFISDGEKQKIDKRLDKEISPNKSKDSKAAVTRNSNEYSGDKK